MGVATQGNLKFLKPTMSVAWGWDELFMEALGVIALVVMRGLAVMMNDMGQVTLEGVALAHFIPFHL